MKIILMAAAHRKGSINKKLIHVVKDQLLSQQHEIDHADFSEFPLPVYDGDIEENEGLPDAVYLFITRMNAADALIISSPEYNFSMPGSLKNFIDWVSRVTPMPWNGQRILLMSTSPSMVGGNRGLWATRIPLEATGAFVFPQMFSLAGALEAFTDSGELKEPALLERLQGTLNAFMDELG